MGTGNNPCRCRCGIKRNVTLEYIMPAILGFLKCFVFDKFLPSSLSSWMECRSLIYTSSRIFEDNKFSFDFPSSSIHIPAAFLRFKNVPFNVETREGRHCEAYGYTMQAKRSTDTPAFRFRCVSRAVLNMSCCLVRAPVAQAGAIPSSIRNLTSSGTFPQSRNSVICS